MVVKQKPNKPSGFRKYLFLAIIVIAAGVFIFSGIKLISIVSGYKKGSDAYKQIEDLSGKTTKEPTSNNDANTPETVSFDVPALKAINADTKGYLFADGVLSYPVVQCDNNSYYLEHLFDGTPNSCGCLFIDSSISEAFEARNCIIYGHDMRDGSMFAALHYYADANFYNEHKEFHVFTEEHHYVYKVMSAFVTNLDGIVYRTTFSSDEDFVSFLNTVAGACPYETDYGELTADRKVITMSTCVGNDDDHRLVVVAIRDREITE